MTSNSKISAQRQGSIFMLVLVAMCVLFILGFALNFFSGSEGMAASVSYEQEVAFGLAESAADELTARLKYYLNDPKGGANILYRNIRAYDLDIKKELPVEDSDLVALTSITRDTAANEFGINTSSDFRVEASFKFKHIDAIKIQDNNTEIYNILEDPKEKDGTLTIRVAVTFKGHTATVTLENHIRVVRTFVPPFNYFTLFVRDASNLGSSTFNISTSTVGISDQLLRLDHGWQAAKQTSDSSPFNPVSDLTWVDDLDYKKTGDEAVFPPGRLYLGQDLNLYANMGPNVYIRATNGYKTSKTTNPLDRSNLTKAINDRDGLLLQPDVWEMNLKDYTKIMSKQGLDKATLAKHQTSKFGVLGKLWNKIDSAIEDKFRSTKLKITMLNVGADTILAPASQNKALLDYQGDPTFGGYIYSLDLENQEEKKSIIASYSNDSKELQDALTAAFADSAYSGFAPLGSAMPKMQGNSRRYTDSNSQFDQLSPTIVYGPAMREYYRITSIKTKDDKVVPFPYIASATFSSEKVNTALQALSEKNKKVTAETPLTSMQMSALLKEAKVPDAAIKDIVNEWDKLDEFLRDYATYSQLMSNRGMEHINLGLVHLLQRIKGAKSGDIEYNPADNSDYDKLYNYATAFLEGSVYPYGEVPSNLQNFMNKPPWYRYYDGALANAAPNNMATYLYDFYFLRRATEDFFKGRITVGAEGTNKDRFIYKYISNPDEYINGKSGLTLTLNGILSLNDSTQLELTNLYFKGHGIIYSSPMLGGGKVFINGDLLSEGTNIETIDKTITKRIPKHMITIVAPHIVIYSDRSMLKASKKRCYVEANLISTSEPLQIVGDTPCTIKGSVVTPYINLNSNAQSYNEETGGKKPIGFHVYSTTDKNIKHEEDVIIYNALNSIWANKSKTLNKNVLEENPDIKSYGELENSLYVAKIVTGGVGTFDWKSERR